MNLPTLPLILDIEKILPQLFKEPFDKWWNNFYYVPICGYNQ